MKGKTASTSGMNWSAGASGITAPTLAAVFGEIVWLLTQSPPHRMMFLGELEWYLMTPMLLEQFRTFRSGDRLVGVALWATVSEDVEKRLESGTAKLAPADWKSGDRRWLVELIAPFGGHETMVADLKKTSFGEHDFKMLVTNADGKKDVVVM